MRVRHTKVSAIPDGADASLVRPSDWNADHTIEGAGAQRHVLRNIGGTAQAITAETGASLAALTQYDTFLLLASTNITGPGPTLAIDGLAPLVMTGPTGQDLAADEITSLKWVELMAWGSPVTTLRVIMGYN